MLTVWAPIQGDRGMSERVLTADEQARWDAMFMGNIREARANGFALACSECGCGILDATDLHDYWCSQHEVPR